MVSKATRHDGREIQNLLGRFSKKYFGLMDIEPSFEIKDQFVYVVSACEFLKVGVSNNVEARVASLQTASPFQLCVLRVYRGGYRLESLIHELLKDNCVRGEWFRVDVECIDMIVSKNGYERIS